MSWEWIAGPLLAIFLTAQIIGIIRGWPFSRWLREKMGTKPRKWYGWITSVILWGFITWFGIHITTPYL